MADQLTGVEVGTGYVTVLPDARGFHDKLRQQVEGGSGESGRRAGDQFAAGFGRALPIVGGALAGMFAADRIKQFASESITAASDLAESGSKVNVVFGDGAAAIQKWAETSSTSVLLSKQAALEAAGTYGNLFTAMGISQVRASELSRQAVQMAADLASFNNRDVGDVLEKIRSGLVGETEPLRDLGINLNQARIQQEALNAHLWDGKGRIDAAAQAQAAFNLIMRDGSNAVGDVDRTATGFANTTRALQAAVENAKASIGQGLVLAAQDASKAFGGPGGLTASIESWGATAGNIILGVEVRLRGLLELSDKVDAMFGSNGDGIGAIDILKAFPGATVSQPFWDWLNNSGQDAQKEIEQQTLTALAFKQTQQDITMQHRAVAAAATAAANAYDFYADRTRSATDATVSAATGVSTLQAALDKFESRSKSRETGSAVRDTWRAVSTMGEMTDVKRQVLNPKWSPGSSLPKYISKTTSERQPFDPDVAGGRFAFTASGDAARNWAVGFGQDVLEKAQQFKDPAEATAYLDRWASKLGKRFDIWGIEKPYAYARSFIPQPSAANAIYAAMEMHQKDREPLQRSGDKIEFHDTVVYSTDTRDFIEQAKRDAHQARAGRLAGSLSTADRMSR